MFKKEKTNQDIRSYLQVQGLKQWQLAKHLEMSESKLSTMMRDELSATIKSDLIAKIDELKKELEEREN